jgi:hypothetical protein
MCLVAQSSDRTKSSGIMDDIGVVQSMSLYSDDSRSLVLRGPDSASKGTGAKPRGGSSNSMGCQVLAPGESLL